MTILSLSSTAHNITLILDGRKQFSTFNHYLSVSHLAEEINRRQTITVLAVDNAAMNELLRKHLSIYTIKNVLSLHVLADYFGAMKLHQITGRTALVSTLFQATGRAQGMSGFVNITNFRGGKVGFGAEDNDGVLDSFFVKSLKEKPYYISVIQISKLLSSSDAEAPTPAPSAYNLTVLMTKKGCKVNISRINYRDRSILKFNIYIHIYTVVRRSPRLPRRRRENLREQHRQWSDSLLPYRPSHEKVHAKVQESHYRR